MPSELQRHVQEHRLGMKTGQGFYQWTRESQQQVRDRLANYLRATLLPKAGEAQKK